MKHIYYVYRHTFPNGKIYIGKGKSNRAYNFHRGHSTYWHRVFSKYKIVCVEILKANLTEKFALHVEKCVIRSYLKKGFKLYDTLVNGTLGGEGMSGFKHSEKSRKKMSKSRMGNTNRKNTKTSKQGIENIRKGQLGKIVSPEAVQKTANALRGKKRPIEVCKKISKANTGKSCAKSTKDKLSQINQDKTIYHFYNTITSINEFLTSYQLGIKYNLRTAGVRSICNGSRKSYHKWVCLK